MRRRRPGHLSIPAVVGVTAQALPTRTLSSPLAGHAAFSWIVYGEKFIQWGISRIWTAVTKCIETVSVQIASSINQFLVRPLGQIAGLLFIRIIRWVDVMGRFLYYWWLRLPDRREIEHRQIAACQFVESLDQLLPRPSIISPSAGAQPGVDYARGTEVERYLDEYFKQSYVNRNPISGLMNIRLMAGGPEFPGVVDFSSLTTKTASKVPHASNPLSVKAMVEMDNRNSSAVCRRPIHSTVYPSGLSQLGYQSFTSDRSEVKAKLPNQSSVCEGRRSSYKTCSDTSNGSRFPDRLDPHILKGCSAPTDYDNHLVASKTSPGEFCTRC